MSGQSLENRRPLVRLSCPSASQVPRRRVVDGYINNQDSNWPIITKNIPRDWSLITGRGAYKMGKSQVRNFLRPPSRQGKTFPAPLLKGGNFLRPPQSLWLTLQAPILKLSQSFLCPPPPPFSTAKTFSVTLFVGVKLHLAPCCFVAPPPSL